MDYNFTDKDKEFLAQAELFYSGQQPLWSDKEYDNYRINVFEPKYGDVTNYVASLHQGEHVSHRESARFKLTKTSITHQYADRCKDILDESSDNIYWMYKYDGCSLVAYYTKGRLTQVCTKSAVEWGIDRTATLRWLFPEVVSENIDSIQGEAVVKVSEIGGEYAARSKANGLINSKYKSDEIRRLVHVRAFKVGFVDLDPSIRRMINALTALPIPEHGRFQVAKRINKSDVSDSSIGTEDILYDGIVAYNMDNDSILGYKRHSDEHLVTKITNIEWNLSSKGLWVPKFNFDEVVFNAVYGDDGEVLGGIHVKRASCGSANRLFSMKAGVGAIVEVYRANSTIPQVSKVIEPSTDYCLSWLDEHYYDAEYEFNYNQDPWKVIDNKGYYCFQGGIKNDVKAPQMSLSENIEYWWGFDNWMNLIESNPQEFVKFIFYKTNFKKLLYTIDNPNLTWYAQEIISGDEDKFNEFTNNIAVWIGYEKKLDEMKSVKDELFDLLKSKGVINVS
jgi:hypothetical protein